MASCLEFSSERQEFEVCEGLARKKWLEPKWLRVVVVVVIIMIRNILAKK
jgi:phage shock protein PspC (stress-responsive transcriptional regulator)